MSAPPPRLLVTLMEDGGDALLRRGIDQSRDFDWHGGGDGDGGSGVGIFCIVNQDSGVAAAKGGGLGAGEIVSVGGFQWSIEASDRFAMLSVAASGEKVSTLLAVLTESTLRRDFNLYFL